MPHLSIGLSIPLFFLLHNACTSSHFLSLSVFLAVPKLNTPFVFWLIWLKHTFRHTHTRIPHVAVGVSVESGCCFMRIPTHIISVFSTLHCTGCFEALHVPCRGIMEAQPLVKLPPCTAHWVLLDHIIMSQKTETPGTCFTAWLRVNEASKSAFLILCNFYTQQPDLSVERPSSSFGVNWHSGRAQEFDFKMLCSTLMEPRVRGGIFPLIKGAKTGRLTQFG